MVVNIQDKKDECIRKLYVALERTNDLLRANRRFTSSEVALSYTATKEALEYTKANFNQLTVKEPLK